MMSTRLFSALSPADRHVSRKRGMVTSLLIVAVASAFAGSACARASGPSEGPQEPSEDWDHPFHEKGVEVSSATIAAEDVGFAVYEPEGLGQAIGIYVSPTAPDELGAVYFVYQTTTYGRVWVGEWSPPDSPDPDQRLASYQAAVADNGKPGVHGTAAIVAVRGATPALLTTAEDGSTSTLEWVEEDLEFVVRGPVLTQVQVLTIANSL
jgi:hypothetical protein